MDKNDKTYRNIKNLVNQIKPVIEADVLAEYSGEFEVISSPEMVEIIKSSPLPSWEANTGLKKIDDLTQGFYPGELITISAPSGDGKTKFCETLTFNWHKQQIPTFWISYEMEPREILRRMGRGYPEFFLPKSIKSNDFEWMKQRVVEAKAKYGCKTVILDHLHYIIEPGKIRNASLDIGQIVRDLKLLAREQEVVIVLVAHCKKAQNGQQFNMDLIRDSSFIVQESDFVIMLKRQEEYDAKDDIRVKGDITDAALLKNRRTGQHCKFSMILEENVFIQHNGQPRKAYEPPADNADFMSELLEN